MDKERLKELKEYVNSLSINTSAEFNKQIDLLALIGAALAEPYADVAEAIERFEKRNERLRQVQDNGDAGCVDIETWERYQQFVEDNDLAITALRQYQKPTDEAVQRAIDQLERDKRYFDYHKPHYGGKLTTWAQEQVDDYDLAIQALRQMRSEPCECKRELEVKPCANGDRGIKASIVDDSVVVWQYGMAMGYFDVKYCPNCGKELVK